MMAEDKTLDPFFRYSRQMLVPYIGLSGQQLLHDARIGLIGCGALGSAIANNLVRAGIGYLRIADKDYPEIHNLHRQVLFTEDDVARRVPKAEAAALHLREANSEVVVEPVVVTIDAESMTGFAEGLQILVDGTDNFPTRFLINEYSIAHDVPWVYGGVIGSGGMSMTVVPQDGPCLRCFVRELPSREHSPTADVAGVLNSVVALIAAVEADEVVKLAVDPAARNRHLLVADIWDLTFERLVVHRDPTCPCCGSG
jgi:molybdopterin/thiamine biosynthesis adenylyltransferase